MNCCGLVRYAQTDINKGERLCESLSSRLCKFRQRQVGNRGAEGEGRERKGVLGLQPSSA